MSAAAVAQALPDDGAMGGTAGSTIGFNVTAPPLTNPGRGGTKVGISSHHPVSNRYPNHWHESTNLNLTQASNMHGHANDLSKLSTKTHLTTRDNNIKQYQCVHDAFSTKVQTSRELVDTLDSRIRSVTTSLQRTKASLASLQSAYNAKKEPLSLCVWRQTTRAKRPQREMIRDNLETALEAEKETLLKSQDQLQDAMHATEHMIISLNDSFIELSHDHEVKLHALQIDESCMRKTHNTWPAVTQSGEAPAKKGSEASMPYAAWHNASEDKRQKDTLRSETRAKDKETYATQLRDENDKLIGKTSQDCAEAKSKVEEKLQDRIAEVQAKRRELEASIQDTQDKIEQMTQSRAMTDTEIRSHDEPESILQHRMDLRAGRHPGENISDPVTTELLEQQHSLKQSRAMLERRKEEEKQSLAMLLKTKADLMADLADKTAALNLDLECQKTVAREPKVMSNMFMRLDL
eukprot:gnl/MRDRNA2_/MRDRNA2_90299_c0_seq1.p1 gnl/MRDRNA2_/MRDRNA2_90299_c0~~gnl/MRDRNA2_/MRDRNA2_90299_c0_seq1.p1  ORF type:complete len:464 (+),score=120.93 gnl/MRDRNA2_/MRDRNA2_90299_c0_seq1:69-1460(+)